MEAALLAPSGDNCQPWKVIMREQQLTLLNVPERDTSLYNFGQRTSLIAHGAFLENAMIASSALGYSANLEPFPDESNPNLVARVSFERSEKSDVSLYPYIPLRTTNRKPYNSKPLTVDQEAALEDTTSFFGFGGVKLLKGDGKKDVARIIGLNDRLVFEISQLHSFLFNHIRWTEEEAQRTGNGLYVGTLEISPFQRPGLRLLGRWPIARALNSIGISRIIGEKAKRLALSASAIGIVTMPGDKKIDFLNGGRIVQRVWLESTKMGLSFQPMTGLVYLMQRVSAGDSEGLSESHIGMIRNAEQGLRTAYALNKETIIMLFRVGYCAPPMARSLRLPMENIVQEV
ncbi:putative Flavin-dependent oxidoreductase [Candidatus Sulfobium mesophilum]|uniref:Putative Flavin-dependent oxidoreductase n=1 Tax=Candidatus Sulfobium mesophilum TaxID=2016548 RepID=A0A2U3QDN5_9BACT|nr:putative Flavin-dependent oxidoreductase [Candidatus Sulfobium mesophilum]